MEPRIQYCQTPDGVSIAFCQGGEGTAFIVTHAPLSNIELEWRDWEWTRILLARRRLIRFDNRGAGLSQRNAGDFSLEAMALDIGAVVDALALETCALYGELCGAPVAIAYAALCPERVSHLILFGGYARGADFFQIPRMTSLMTMLDHGDWELFTDTFGLAQVGWELAEVAHGLGEFSRACMTLEQAQTIYGALRRHDASDLLARVRAPTLVLHPRGTAFPTLEMAQRLAAGIPAARLKVLESETFWSDQMEPQLLDALDEFIGDGGRPTAVDVQPQARRPVPAAPAALVTVLFTDIDDSTGLTQRLGDARAKELVRAHNAIVREALGAHSGSEIKHTGDGIMASFPTASGALECAMAIQRAAEERSVGAHGHAPLQIHIGLNAGEPVAEERDLFGTAVQLARRICDQASGGEVLVSDVVWQLAAGKGYLFADRGEVALRGFEDPVRLYELRWREASS